jgi:hypothetical protein
MTGAITISKISSVVKNLSKRIGMPLKAVISLLAGPTTTGLKNGLALPVCFCISKDATEKRSKSPVRLEDIQFCTAKRATVYMFLLKFNIVHINPYFVDTDTSIHDTTVLYYAATTNKHGERNV